MGASAIFKCDKCGFETDELSLGPGFAVFLKHLFARTATKSWRSQSMTIGRFLKVMRNVTDAGKLI